MRILHLLGADEDTGGILSVLRNLQTATAAPGCLHVVWVNRAYREVRQPSLDYRYSRHLIAESPNHLRLLLGAVRAWGELRALQRTGSFDVLHAHSRGAFLLAALSALTRRDTLFTNHAYAQRTGMYRRATRLKHFHTCCLTPSMARHYGLPENAARLHIVSACYADRFLALPLAGGMRGRTTAGRIRLVGIGNIVRWKNWHLLIEAWARLAPPDKERIEFHHWGPTPHDADAPAYARELLAGVGRHGLAASAFFHGPLLGVEEALCRADWFVIPSTNEPCSVALMEALAMGVPALASASGGNVDIVRDGQTGLLFEPDNVEAVTACLVRLLRGEPGIRDSAAIRESVRHRSASAVGRQYLALYESLASVGMGRS